MNSREWHRYKGVGVESLYKFLHERDAEILELNKLIRSLSDTIAYKNEVIALYYNKGE